MTATREQPAETAERTERPARKPAPPKKARPKGIGMPNDPVADLLTRVRNAAGARHETVSVPTSRMRSEERRVGKECRCGRTAYGERKEKEMRNERNARRYTRAV